MKSMKMLIGGRWTEGSGNGMFPVVNPATGEDIAVVPYASAKDVEDAISAADNAFESWSSLTPFQRGKFLRTAGNLVMERSEKIARLMTAEQGKPFREALGETIKGADILRYYAEEGERIYGRIIANENSNDRSFVVYEPVGVVAAISPWNYPIELAAWKIGAALATGCTIICKLPSITPLSPLAFIECLHDSGIPDGAINALTGKGSDIGSLLIKSEKVKKVAFTGSTETGMNVIKMCSNSLKKVSLELGGSLPMVVCKDCCLEEAVRGAVRRSFRNMGQICIAINRIYVDRNIYKKFIELFVKETKKLTIGNGLENDYDLGPMATSKGIEVVMKHINDAVSKGAVISCGGRKPEGKPFEKGNFFEPTILRDTNHSMLVMKEETFGPLVGVMPFDSIDQAIQLANDNRYGLAAIIYTQDMSLANYLSMKIEAGNVAINNVDAGVINAPYGGWKESGLGYEHGPEGLYEYLKIKHIRCRFIRV